MTNNELMIRHTQLQDLPQLLAIYARAREFMCQHDNPRQWRDYWPPEDVILEDIAEKRSFACVGTDTPDDIEGVFVFIYGSDIDPTYLHIEAGDWKDPSAYGVVHRIATAGKRPGVGTFCLQWAYEQSRHHLRIDTHGDNYVMQNLVKKLGFTYCGIIHVIEDGDPRLAFEKSDLMEI